MTGDLQRAAHVVRTVLLAATSLGSAAVAHAAAGGSLPGTFGLGALVVLTLAVSSIAARARFGLWFLVGFLTLLQVFLHHAFAWSTPAGPGSAGTPDAAYHPGSHHVAPHGGASGAPGADAAMSAPEQLTHLVHLPQPPMIAAHAGAVLVTALLMTACERAARVALDVWAHVLPTLLRAGVVVVPRVPAPTGRVAPRPRSVLDVRTTPRRGPPAGVLALG